MQFLEGSRLCGLIYFSFALLLTESVHSVSAKTSSKLWNTRTGSAPLIVARGGSSGLFPDQTVPAYIDALKNSLDPIALLCDLQLTGDGANICRTGLDLGNSTTISFNSSYTPKQYVVNGKQMTGYFAIDYTVEEVNGLTVMQPIQSRSPDFDMLYPVLHLEDVIQLRTQIDNEFLIWLNVQYAAFFKEHDLDLGAFVRSAMASPGVQIDFISSPEVAFLKSLKVISTKTKTKLVFQFLGQEEVEPTTNVTYGELLKNLKSVRSFASGILVPKNFIWPVDAKGSYLEARTAIVQEAHTAGLEIYASGFVNDPIVVVYNYSLDPVREYLQFVSGTGDIVDGVVTDFPTTASAAIACFSPSSQVALSKAATKRAAPLVISHNGASGDFPGCTYLAYEKAIKDGVDFIDCPIQMTKDGIPICRESPDLLLSTDVSSHLNLFMSRKATIPEFQAAAGVFSTSMTLEEVQSLKARMYSPEGELGVLRNPAYDGNEGILRLSDFLSWASQNASQAGILIDIQNAYFIETALHLDVVNSVIAALDNAGYTNSSSRVLIQSEDSAVLKRFQEQTSYRLIYRIANESVSITNDTLKQIKQLAGIVSLPRGLVTPTTTKFFLENTTTIVEACKAQNLTVFLNHLRNEYVAFPFDYEADPTLELHTVVEVFKVDGIVTDFPATARAYLGNGCRMEQSGYALQLVTPGDLLTSFSSVIPQPPASRFPELVIGEPALPPVVMAPSPLPTEAAAPSSRSTQNAAVQLRCLSSPWWMHLSMIFLCTVILYA